MHSAEMGQKTSTLHLNESLVKELKDRTKMSTAELRSWYKHFLEEHPDGSISKEEFIEMQQEVSPPGADCTAYAEQLFSAYDRDNNGFIDFREFVLTLNVSNNGTSKQKLSWAFDLYDQDKDGFLSREEALKIIQAIYEMKGIEDAHLRAEETTTDLFSNLDRNQDDKISRNEFMYAGRRSSVIDNL